jgi:hypothetical protein
MSTRRLSQTDVVTGEKRRTPEGFTATCLVASDSHVCFTDTGLELANTVIRRDVWTSWPVIEEADR